ncbi:hypothetical protein C2E31_15600 [Rhodopirellula baltica]|nr:hypothetical protein C2E31_15600 [Rhodopirellula baltica]
MIGGLDFELGNSRRRPLRGEAVVGVAISGLPPRATDADSSGAKPAAPESARGADQINQSFLTSLQQSGIIGDMR